MSHLDDTAKKHSWRHPLRRLAAQRAAAAAMSAIERSQAAIEFSLDGQVLAANDIFLQALGYGLHELLGRPHALLLERLTATASSTTNSGLDCAAESSAPACSSASPRQAAKCARRPRTILCSTARASRAAS